MFGQLAQKPKPIKYPPFFSYIRYIKPFPSVLSPPSFHPAKIYCKIPLTEAASVLTIIHPVPASTQPPSRELCQHYLVISSLLYISPLLLFCLFASLYIFASLLLWIGSSLAERKDLRMDDGFPLPPLYLR